MPPASWVRSAAQLDHQHLVASGQLLPAESEWRATWGGEGGGVLVNRAPHQLDLLQWILRHPTKSHLKNINGSHRKDRR